MPARTDARPAIRSGKKIILRPAFKTDIPNFLIWFNDPEVNAYLNRYLPIYEKDEEEFIDSLSQKKETDIVFMIETLCGAAIGAAGLHHINMKDRVATFGIAIGEKAYWNKGIGTETLMLVLHYAFMTLNLRKVTLSVFANNKRGYACYAKCGFIVEGCRMKQIYKNGKYEDEILMAVFKRNWLPVWRKYRRK